MLKWHSEWYIILRECKWSKKSLFYLLMWELRVESDWKGTNAKLRWQNGCHLFDASLKENYLKYSRYANVVLYEVLFFLFLMFLFV